MASENSPDWKVRVQEILRVCQSEIKRTTEIGKKMILAGKTNTSLHQAYEELGALVVEELKAERLEWKHPRVQSILDTIGTCEKNLKNIEKEVNEIRFANDKKNVKTTVDH